MANRKLKIVAAVGLVLGAVYVAARVFVPPMLEARILKPVPHAPYKVSDEAKALHSGLTVMDWHADALLWNRDLTQPSDRGYVTLPSMQAGNMALQMFTTVTKVPWKIELRDNPSDSDMITAVSVISGWPVASWNSLTERALYQALKLNDAVARSEGGMMWVRNQKELQALMAARAKAGHGGPIGVLLGAEGGHPLEGDLMNLDRLYAAGFRMIGLTHFFDNEIGGSLHGQSGAGLSDFGHGVIHRMDDLGMIIDVAHASEQSVRDTLALTTRPVVISHTGLRGTCKSDRNLPDDLVQTIAAKGGLIAIGMWQDAVCGTDPDTIAATIAYGVRLAGPDHIALGSDWDGAVPEAVSPADLPALTDALLRQGLDHATIAKVMGGNSAAFLARWLPME
ncbi:MAG: peptidase M19 [Alphaproteobacteria bacterium]|nr:MAG: peptidase M19 [Alphaproteobacteria bacterium]